MSKSRSVWFSWLGVGQTRGQGSDKPRLNVPAGLERCTKHGVLRRDGRIGKAETGATALPVIVGNAVHERGIEGGEAGFAASVRGSLKMRCGIIFSESDTSGRDGTTGGDDDIDEERSVQLLRGERGRRCDGDNQSDDENYDRLGEGRSIEL